MQSSLNKILSFGCLVIFVGCVATTDPVVPRVTVDTLQQQLLTLPGAVVDLETLTVTYPDEVLFASGAALPFPGGMELLAPLMSLVLQDAEIYGEAKVRSSGYTHEYDRMLAEKRLELLELLFKNRGVTPERLTLIVDEGEGAPLEIRFQLRSDATSSGKN